MNIASLCTVVLCGCVVGALALSVERAVAQGAADPNAAPNPYRVQENWAQLPPGRKWGQTIGIDIDPDGKSIWTFDRCGARDCIGKPDIAPIQKFDSGGKLLVSFGAGLFNYPHGLHIDRPGNVW